MEAVFGIEAKDPATRARTGTLDLPHGRVRTPVFMPVGTAGAVKAVSREDLDGIGFEIILANTYHLFVRPGQELVREAGGLHGFTGWKGNFLTDSGGFQVFSMSALRKLTEEGVHFKSHLDGSALFLSPEDAVAVQAALASDVQMQLDVCTPYGAGREESLEALRLTSAWAGRAKVAWEAERARGYRGLLFPIVQGNFHEDLRRRSADEILELDLPGVALGGLSVGEPREIFKDMLAFSASLLPEGKPRYLMGIGTPDYILEAVENGIDMFDCVFPTRVARNGLLFTSRGPLSIKQARFERDFGPIDPLCACRSCQRYSRAYMRHLYKCGEILYSMAASYHNLWFLQDLVRKIRYSIKEGGFPAFKRDFLASYGSGEL